MLASGLGTETLVGQTPPVTADFRVDTDVLEPGQNKPIDQSVTLFVGGVAYEYAQAAPERITVIDAQQNRITFIDTARQVQTRVNLQELQAFMESAKHKFAAEGGTDKIQDAELISFDPNTRTAQVGQRFIRYSAKLAQPPQSSFAEQYASFANASAMINAWRSRGSSPPPFARLALNKLARQHQCMPTEITRSITVGQSESSLISRLHATYQLTNHELEQVKLFDSMLLNYPTLTLAEYTNPSPALSR